MPPAAVAAKAPPRVRCAAPAARRRCEPTRPSSTLSAKSTKRKREVAKQVLWDHLDELKEVRLGSAVEQGRSADSPTERIFIFT